MPVQVNVAADQQNLINSIERGVRAYNQRFSKSNTINLNINERGFSQPLGRITGAVNDFESAMAASNARVIAFGASTAVLGSAVAGFKSLAKASIEVEKNLADVNRILQLNTDTLQQFGKELFNISKRTATSFNDASKALLEFSRQGLSAEETLRRTNDALTLTRLAGLGAEASVAALTATVNGFAKSGITTTQVLNKLVAVEQAFAVSARDLSEGLSRTGQAAQEAGVNIDQLNALISAAQQRTARGGAVIGNALKTIFTRLQRSDTLDRLEEFNIAVRDVQGNTLPATTILQNFASAYNRLADAQRAQLSEQVAGVYQVNILKAVVSDLNSEQSIYNQALLKGANATNEASRANAQLNQTLSALLTQVGNNSQQLASTIGSVTFEPLAKSAAKAANSILESLTDVLTGDGIGSDLANGLLKGIRNVLGGPGAVAAFYTLFKLVQSSFTYVAQALPQVAGITTETQKRQNLEQAILGILQSENNISKSILGNTGNQKRQAEILLGVARQQTAQYREQLRLAGSLATTLRGQGVTVGARGLQAGRTRSGGYIPASTRMAERAGAFAGGYAPGKVVNSPVGGVMNTAEDVKYVPGFAQPFINPPKNSRAGKLHRANAVKQVGVDPYQYRGFVPNFAKIDQILGKSFVGSLDKLGLVGGGLSKVRKVANVRDKVGKRIITDTIGGQGINYVKKEIGDFTGSDYYEQAEILAYGDTKTISRVLPASKKSNFNYDQWKINRASGKAKVPSLESEKIVSFKRQLTGLKNLIAGELFEREISDQGYKRNSPNARFDFIAKSNKKFLGSEAKVGKYDLANLVSKAIGTKGNFKNSISDYINLNLPIELLVPRKKPIPNFAAAYRNPFTGALNNAAIARGLKSGKLTAQQAEAMGYSTSESKIDARKNKRAAAVNALNYTMAYVPWDIEGFRGGRSGGRLNIAQGTAYEKFILDLLRSGKLKGTTSLGAPFSLPARPDVVSSAALKGGTSARIDAYSLSAGEMYEMKAGDPGATLAGLQNKFVKAIENNPEILDPKRKWKNYIFRTTKAKGRGASGGFIPNFAYKGQVMDLEEFISGQKAIYSESPFPHVRNESQPTFASAIADHGGLGNALRDSYRNQSAAGMVYGGYVPNFADDNVGISEASILKGFPEGSRLTEEMADKLRRLNGNLEELATNTDLSADEQKKLTNETNKLKREIVKGTGVEKVGQQTSKKLKRAKELRAQAEQKAATAAKTAAKERRSQMFGRAGTALAIGGPMLAGLAEQAFFGDTARADLTAGERMAQSGLSSGLTAVSTGAGIGAAFGPLGAAIGGAAGGLIGLTSALNAAELSAEELAQVNQKVNEQNQKTLLAAESYITARKSLTGVISSGGSESEVEAAAKKLKDSFDAIKDTKLQEMFIETGGDVQAMSEQLRQYTETITRRAAARDILSSDSRSRASDVIASQLGIATSNRSSSEVVEFLKNVQSTVNLTRSAVAVQSAQNNYGGGASAFDVAMSTDLAVDLKRQQDQLEIARKSVEEQAKNNPLNLPATLFSQGDVAEQYTAISKKVAEFLGLSEDNTANYDDIIENFRALLKDGTKFEEIIAEFQKRAKNQNLLQDIVQASVVAEESFNSIFRSINKQLEITAVETSRLVEGAESDFRIQNQILDFTSSFNDQILSFVGSNLPELEKLKLVETSAKSKTEAALAKLQLDYEKSQADFVNQRNKVLQENTKALVKDFESSLVKSQESGQSFNTNVLPLLEQGRYSESKDLIAQIGREERDRRISDFNKLSKETGLDQSLNLRSDQGVAKTADQVTDTFNVLQKAIEDRIQILESGGANTVGSTATLTEELEGLKKTLDELRQSASAVVEAETEISKERLQTALDVKTSELEKFDNSQVLAKKELNIAKAFAQQKLQVEQQLSVQRSKIDAQNLARARAAEITSSRLGFASNIDQARRRGEIALAEDAMNDPRANYGLGLKEITENRIKAEEDIIQKRRAAEDAQIDIEMRQSLLRLNAEIQNTRALERLNESVLRLIGAQLSEDKDVQAIRKDVQLANGMGMDDETIRQTYGDAAASKYFALREVESSLSQTGTRSSELEKALELQKVSGEINAEELRAAAEKDGWSKMELQMLEEQFENRKSVLDIERDIEDILRRNANIRAREGVDLGGNFRAGIGAMKKESDTILNNLAREAPSRFADGMANALSQVADGTKSIGDAFTDMAIDFGRMLQQEVFRALAQRAVGNVMGNLFGTVGAASTGALGGNMRGGIIKAQNGMYISGGRTGDRNLALLEDGEYVLNRNAVKSMGGPRALDRLNFGMAPRFQGGGGYSMEAARSLKNDEYDYTGDLMFNGANIGPINPDLYSAYAFENDAYFQRQKEIAQENLQRRIQKIFEKRQKRAQLIGSIIGAAGSLAMGYGMSGMMSGPSTTYTGGAFGGGKSTTTIKGVGRITGDNLPATIMLPQNMVQKGGFIGYNSGGFVPHGSRLSDTIPAMLTGGEYVMNNNAVKKYGLGTMNSMNAGAYQSGGMTSATTNNTNNNSTSISINVDRSGKAVYGASTNSYEKDDIVLSKEMAQQINALVLKSMVNEKRYGGELYKNPLRT